MEDVSRRIVNDMAACIKANVEAAEPAPGVGGASSAGSSGGGTGTPANPPPQVTAKPVNALSLFFQVLWSGIRHALGAKGT
jgi:hypothetical protein